LVGFLSSRCQVNVDETLTQQATNACVAYQLDLIGTP